MIFCILDIILTWFDSTSFTCRMQTVFPAGARSFCLSEDVCSTDILNLVPFLKLAGRSGRSWHNSSERYVVLRAREMRSPGTADYGCYATGVTRGG